MVLEAKLVHKTPYGVDEDGEWVSPLFSIEFVDSNIGWAVGSGQLLHTSDGGITWVDIFQDHFDSREFTPNHVSALDPTSCWILGLPFDEIRCVFTRDAGNSWTEKEFDKDFLPRGLYFLDSKHGWIIGEKEAGTDVSAIIYLTANGGLTWQEHSLGLQGRPEIVRFVDPQHGWLLETLRSAASSQYLISTSEMEPGERTPLAWPEATQLHGTNDGGISWRLLSSFPGNVADICILAPNHFFVFGENGYIAESKDGGTTWQQCEPLTELTINALAFSDDGIGLACGDETLLMISIDNGRHWEILPPPPNYHGGSYVRFMAPLQGVLGSDRGIHLFQLSPK